MPTRSDRRTSDARDRGLAQSPSWGARGEHVPRNTTAASLCGLTVLRCYPRHTGDHRARRSLVRRARQVRPHRHIGGLGVGLRRIPVRAAPGAKPTIVGHGRSFPVDAIDNHTGPEDGAAPLAAYLRSAQMGARKPCPNGGERSGSGYTTGGQLR